jgi:hypothetical protein
MAQRWVDYCESLSALPNISINEWLDTSQSQTLQTHGFCDVSTRAYIDTIYLCIVNITGSIDVHLIAFKFNVASIKIVSIPNLELYGTVLLVQLIIHIKRLTLYEELSVFH